MIYSEMRGDNSLEIERLEKEKAELERQLSLAVNRLNKGKKIVRHYMRFFKNGTPDSTTTRMWLEDLSSKKVEKK